MALPLLTLVASLDVRAQSREVLVGASGGQERFERGERAGGYGERRSLGVGRLEFEAEGMLEQARRSLDRGQPMDARRRLEMVIERYSQTPAADEARRLLAPIYSASAGPTGGPSRPTAEPTPGYLAAQDSRPPVQHDPSRQDLERPWNTEIRQGRGLDKDFQTNVGDRVFFGDASVELGAKARVVLANQAAWLKRYPGTVVTVEAHADDRGSREHNADLAQRRGEAVRSRLIEEGVEPSRIKLTAVGRDVPVAPCADPACSAQNRRVITVIGDGGAQQPASTAPDGGSARRLSFERGRR